jgi:predicted enzyme related to lactoylglutathione lyase
MTQQATSPPDSGVDDQLAIPGKVSYLEIPAVDAQQSAAFYRDVFGWEIRGDHPGRPSFSDAGGLIGAFETNHAVAREGGVLPYIYVNGIDGVVSEIAAHGGELVRGPFPEGNLWVATFRDPAGNLMGVWQAGPR